MKRIVYLLLAVMICTLLYPSFAFASSNQPSAEQVFNQKEVNQLIDEIHEKELVPDKADESAGRGASLQTKALSSMGSYPRRKGVILVTGDAFIGLIPTGHAAIIYSDDYVVEALWDGVTVGLNNWDKEKHTCYGVTVKGTTTTQDKIAANWCMNQRWKDYNLLFYNTGTRSCFYCSQLVWAAFKDNFGIDLNTEHFGAAIHPMELVWTNKTRKIYEK